MSSTPIEIDAYDPWAPEVLDDPYPYYEWLRANAPAYHVADHDIWVISRYADVVAALRDPATFSSNQGNSYERRPVPMLVGLDPPEHTRLRRVVSRHWTPRVISTLAPRIQRLVDELLDAALAKGDVDFVSDICEPLPITLIAEIMGIPDENFAQFREWSDATVAQMAGPPTEANELKIVEFAMYFLDLVSRRQATFDSGEVDIDDPNDMVGILFGRTPDGERLAPEEIVAMCVLLVVAGNETTTNLMANMGLEVLCRRPEIWDECVADPTLIASFVEEGLRFTSPVQGLFRNTITDVTIGGATIPADSKVLLCYASANRDTDQWPDAAEFRLDRYPDPLTTTDHVAFAQGIHHCLGAHLARLEAVIMFETFARRVGTFAQTGPVEWGANPSIRGMRHLPAHITPR
ncbi:MAG: cytochrome P450 [Acidimicrobiales bacterium]